MPSIFSISAVTDVGRAAMQEALDEGYVMQFTSMKTGNGIYTAGEDVTGMTALKSLKDTYQIGSLEEDANGVTVGTVFVNYDGVNIIVDEDYNINEIGLFCTVNGTETLYAVAAVPNDEGMVMPAYDVSAQNLTQFVQEWYVANSNDAEIDVDFTGAYVRVDNIVDNLTSTSTSKPLSANQGKVLKGLIDNVDNSSAYGVCSTAVATAAKTVTTGGFTLATGNKVIVKFENGNTASNPTLNVDGTGAKAIYMNGAAIEDDFEENGTYLFVYNGTQYDLVGGGSGLSAVVPIPTPAVNSFTYDGTAKTLVFENLQIDNVIITDDSETNAGSYTCTVALKNAQKQMWADGTTADKSFPWSIAKADPTLEVSPLTMTFDKLDYADKTITVTSDSDGAISVSDYDTNIITVTGAQSPYTVSCERVSGETTITVSQAATTNYNAASKTVSVSATFTTIYGVEWDGSATTAWSRTDAAESFVDPTPAVNNGAGSSPFDNCAPWKNIERRTDSQCGEVVYIPKFYTKITKTGSKLKVQIADGPADGFVPAPAFQDTGDGRGELDYILVGRYHCASDFKSKTGVNPHGNITRAAFRTGIHNLGTDVYQWDYAVRLSIFYLYLVEFADWNSQAKIGYGCSPSSSLFNMGATDSMGYHTGTTAASRTTYGSCQYRYIEGLWDNVYDFIDGIYFSGANVYIIKNPENFSDSSNGTLIGTRATSGGYISAWFISSADGYEEFMYPSAAAGSDSTYVCDYCYYGASGVVLYAGGSYYQNQYHGLFYLHGHYDASFANADIGSRLLKKPSAA